MKFSIFVLLLFSFFQCKTSYESLLEEIQQLIQKEDFETAKKKLERRLSRPRNSDEILSEANPSKGRLLEVSQNRNRVIWVEKKTLHFRDFANPNSAEHEIPGPASGLSLSNSAEFALVEIPLKREGGCLLYALSTTDDRLEYESGAHISCKNRSAIDSGGDWIYYFVDDDLYRERTQNPPQPEKWMDKSEFKPPYSKIKTVLTMYPFGKGFLVFAGNAGAYNLYYIEKNWKTSKQIDKDILSPALRFENENSAYYVGGSIGKLQLRRISLDSKNNPDSHHMFSLGEREIQSWKLSDEKDYLSAYDGEVFLWRPMQDKRTLPIRCNRIWSMARGQILCEGEKQMLFLSSGEFSNQDWNILDLYNQVNENLN